MKAILVGGPCDHEIKNISLNCTEIIVPIQDITLSLNQITYHKYVKDWLGYSTSGEEQVFCRYELLSHKEAIGMVFDFYGNKP